MKTQHLNRSFSFASVLALVTGLVAAPIPAQADVTEESVISDPVLQVGGDETSRNLSWMSESSGGGEVRWAPARNLCCLKNRKSLMKRVPYGDFDWRYPR